MYPDINTYKESRDYAFNYEGLPNETQVLNALRQDLTDLFRDFISWRFGSNNQGIIGKNTIGFKAGATIDEDGFPFDIHASVQPKTKSFKDHTKKNGDIIEAFDLEQAIKKYKIEENIQEEE